MKPRPIKPIEERFWSKVDKRGPNDCWEWIAGKNQWGYGRIGNEKGEMENASRVSWRLANHSEIPAGMHIRHTCDNPSCVNPRHLILGTAAENAQDRSTHGRFRLTGKRTPAIDADKVREIRRIYNQKEKTACEIAKSLGVSITAIRKIVNRKSWKNI